MPFWMVQWYQLMLPSSFLFLLAFLCRSQAHQCMDLWENLINVMIVLPYCIFYHVSLTNLSLITELKRSSIHFVYLLISNICVGVWLFLTQCWFPLLKVWTYWPQSVTVPAPCWDHQIEVRFIYCYFCFFVAAQWVKLKRMVKTIFLLAFQVESLDYFSSIWENNEDTHNCVLQKETFMFYHAQLEINVITSFFPRFQCLIGKIHQIKYNFIWWLKIRCVFFKCYIAPWKVSTKIIYRGNLKGAERCRRMPFSDVPSRKFYFTRPTNVCGPTFTIKLSRVLYVTTWCNTFASCGRKLA